STSRLENAKQPRTAVRLRLQDRRLAFQQRDAQRIAQPGLVADENQHRARRLTLADLDADHLDVVAKLLRRLVGVIGERRPDLVTAEGDLRRLPRAAEATREHGGDRQSELAHLLAERLRLPAAFLAEIALPG